MSDHLGRARAADTRAEVIELIRAAVALHLEGLRRDGDPVPPPQTTAVEVDVPLTIEANMSAAV